MPASIVAMIESVTWAYKSFFGEAVFMAVSSRLVKKTDPLARTLLAPPWGGGGGDSPALMGKGWEWVGLDERQLQGPMYLAPHECLSPHKSPLAEAGGCLLGGFMRGGDRPPAFRIGDLSALRPSSEGLEDHRA
jgi:hypothetical protein